MGPRLGFIIVTLMLFLLGMVIAYSASSIFSLYYGTEPLRTLKNQLIFAAIGVACIFLLVKLFPTYVWHSRFAWIVWGIMFALIVATALYGTSEGGAQRWLPLFGVEFQPAEFVKPVLCVISAHVMMEVRENNLSILQLLLRIGAIAIPVGVLYVSQSDLGTAVICAICVLAVLYFAGAPKGIFVALVAFGALAVYFSIVGTGYRSNRFVYLDPYNDGEGGYGLGYQTIRSLYAFADGGIFGVGLGNSLEKYLYLPAINTDYVFAAIGEELGLVGCTFVIVLFILFMYFGYRIAREASNEFASILAGSMTTTIVFQAFLNMGCAISLFPMTGKPLPFISVGGTSLVATLIMVGFILAVSWQAGKDQDYAAHRADLRVIQRADADAAFSHQGKRNTTYRFRM